VEPLSPHLIASLTITQRLGFVMVWLAARKRMTEARDLPGNARRAVSEPRGRIVPR
jgi:hypothetical protein